MKLLWQSWQTSIKLRSSGVASQRPQLLASLFHLVLCRLHFVETQELLPQSPVKGKWQAARLITRCMLYAVCWHVNMACHICRMPATQYAGAYVICLSLSHSYNEVKLLYDMSRHVLSKTVVTVRSQLLVTYSQNVHLSAVMRLHSGCDVMGETT